MVASWACEVILIPKQKSSSVPLCVRISVTSQTHIHLAISVVYEIF